MPTITKGSIVNRSLSLLRISGMTRDPIPEDMQLGLSTLEFMLLGLENDGLRLGYFKSASYPDPDPAEESGIRDKDLEAII